MQSKPPCIIAISGPPGSGKGTTVEGLAKETGFKKASAGNLMRREAQRRGMIFEQYEDYLGRCPEGDFWLDTYTRLWAIEHGMNGGVIIEGRLAAFVAPESALRVLLTVNQPLSYQRVADRDGISVSEAEQQTIRRERGYGKRFKKRYGIGPNTYYNPEFYHLIINTEVMDTDRVVRRIILAHKGFRVGLWDKKPRYQPLPIFQT